MVQVDRITVDLSVTLSAADHLGLLIKRKSSEILSPLRSCEEKIGGKMNPSPSNAAVESRQTEVFSGKVMMGAIVALFTVVFFILLLHIYVRWRFIRRTSRRARRRPRRRLVFASALQVPILPSVHRGLDPSVLVSLPVTLFSSDAEEEDEFVECAVCLSEFSEGEKIRGLPLCGHRFHIDCIDMWLHSHSTCPLCRAAIEGAKEVDPLCSNGIPAIDHAASSVATVRTEEEAGSSSSYSSGREVRIGITAGGGEGFYLESAENEPLKAGSNPTVLIRLMLKRDPRLDQCRSSGSVVDLERGDRSDTPTSPAAPSGQ
ncbi:hypothetical protein HPP92_024916 [Vanilla planifolia]|uniref:RING-type E3 ubiquitin transferase n=1 Tax=Vanilla planifolia TaxID=51239 RepID=A0A835PP03_VANPL|nr:hypothetical protein HPP92_024916 [Vanilla planifolia]